MLQTKALRGQKRLIHLSGLLMLSVFANSYAAIAPTTNPNGTPVYHDPTTITNEYDKAVPHPPIPLLDEDGVNVLTSQKAYSPKKSCAGSGCHDYDKITSAYHFQMGRDEADDNYGAKRGLPQLVSPGYYGGYNCMGGSNQTVLSKKNNTSAEDFADYGSAGFVKRCYGCHTGGGYAEYDRDGIRYDQKNVADIKPLDGDYFEPMTMKNGHFHAMAWDWKKSGVVEADCMICHTDIASAKVPEDSGLKALKPPVRLTRTARRDLISKGFFREGATGLLEVVTNTDGKNLVTIKRSVQPEVGHDGKPKLDKDGKPVTSLQVDLDANGKPQFVWHADAFDSKGRATIPMLRFPANQNCMQCHSTSNSRRGFYGFGESAKSTIEGAGLTDLNGGSTGVLVEDYQDDVHKGKKFVMDNGEMRVIDNCNACHDKQYYKSPLASVDLNADHNFNKGNSDMDVRNDLDYNPNALSCEFCHINTKTPIIPSGHDSQLAAHREIWKGRGYMSGYNKVSLDKITQRHFDVVACQTCHIVNKKGRRGADLQIMYRYREAEDGKLKMMPYNPKLRYYWKDKVSGYVLVKRERNSVFAKSTDADGKLIGKIVDPISGEQLGTVAARESRHGLRYSDPSTYEDFVALKKAYDNVLIKKGYKNPDTTLVWTESYEYVISHNVRPSPQSMPCGDCHAQKQNGAFSSLVSPKGVLGTANIKVVTTIPDNRLVEEGIITLDMPYMKLQPNGDITENVEDILYTTRIDPFMTLLKNSSANEVLGRFNKVKTADLLAGVAGTPFAENMQADFTSPDSFLFQVNKGAVNLRNMIAAIDGNLSNKVLFPNYSAVIGKLVGAEAAAQGVLDAGQYGKLRSDVFYFDVQDKAKKSVQSLNGAYMYVKAAYKGNRSDVNSVNVITADMGLTAIKQIPASDILMIQPASNGNPAATVAPNLQTNEGFVIFRTTTLGYFIVADK